MKKYKLGLIILFTISIIAVSYTALQQPAPKTYKETQFFMDTIIEITATGLNSEAAVKEALGEFKRIHDITNSFEPKSQISQVNQQAGLARVTVAPDMISLLKRANQLSDMAEGAFDVTIGPLSDLWGIGRKGDYVPSPDEIGARLPLVNYKAMEIDEANNTLYLPQKGMLLDLGGIAKGYAVDLAIEKLKALGITSALINAGGDVRIIGTKPDGKPWRIGIQDPRNNANTSGKLTMTQWDTMETSGDYQRFFMKNDTRYSHILDPRTGLQPRKIISVTIINNNSSDGDVLSTAVFVLGVDKGLALLAKFPGKEAVIITDSGEKIVTQGLKGKLEI